MSRKFMIAGFVVAAGVMAMAATAQADLLNLTQRYPDVMAGFISTTYDPGTDVFHAAGYVFTYAPNSSVAEPIKNAGSGPGSFDLLATIDGAGNMSSVDLTVYGRIPAESIAYSLLLNEKTPNSPLKFGYKTGTSLFEFVIDIDPGSALYPKMGSRVGIILDAKTAFGGLDASYCSTGGRADIFAVPAPSALMLALMAGFCAVPRKLRQYLAAR